MTDNPSPSSSPLSAASVAGDMSPYAELLNRSDALRPYIIGVDLHLLSAGGVNGGVKQQVFAQLGWIQRRHGERLKFVFLVNRAVVGEVRQAFPDAEIRVVCSSAVPLASSPGSVFFLKIAWKTRGLDMVYAPLWFSPYHSHRRPTVALMVDFLHRDHPEFLSGEAERQWREKIVGFSSATAARVQTISRTMAERLQHYYGVSAERLVTTYLPLHARLKEVAPALDIPSRRGFFFYPANLWPHKNHERLLAGYALYRGRVGADAWSLVLSGHPDEKRKAELEAEAQLRGIPTDSFRFLGFLADAAFAKLLATAGALIFPSLYEGFGMPLLEAMHFRVPIAASRAAAIPEIAGDAALFFDPYDPQALADAMFQLSTQADLRRDLVKKGIERLQIFDADKETEKLAEAFFVTIQEFKARKLSK